MAARWGTCENARSLPSARVPHRGTAGIACLCVPCMNGGYNHDHGKRQRAMVTTNLAATLFPTITADTTDNLRTDAWPGAAQYLPPC